MALKPGGPPLPGDGSGDRHMPGGRRPLGPANGGVTEDWGYVILRIKEDLRWRGYWGGGGGDSRALGGEAAERMGEVAPGQGHG